MKPHSVGLEEITRDNIITIDLDGNIVAGNGRRHSEVYIHSEIYKVRREVHCVIHAHPPYCVALSATGRPLRCYSQPSALFHEALGVYADTINLIRSPEMGAGVARALGGHRAVLLKNHGVVAVGANIAEAVVGVIMLENAAMIQLAAEAAGDPAPEFSTDDIAKLNMQIAALATAPVNLPTGNFVTYPPGAKLPNDWPSDDNLGPNAYRGSMTMLMKLMLSIMAMNLMTSKMLKDPKKKLTVHAFLLMKSSHPNTITNKGVQRVQLYNRGL
jgi:L-fuculose-phosphate aldolase